MARYQLDQKGSFENLGNIGPTYGSIVYDNTVYAVGHLNVSLPTYTSVGLAFSPLGTTENQWTTAGSLSMLNEYFSGSFSRIFLW